MYGLIFDFAKMAEIGFCNPRGSPPVAKPEQVRQRIITIKANNSNN
jgi:hypothetical protein